jgi:hypothetical protein
MWARLQQRGPVAINAAAYRRMDAQSFVPNSTCRKVSVSRVQTTSGGFISQNLSLNLLNLRHGKASFRRFISR